MPDLAIAERRRVGGRSVAPAGPAGTHWRADGDGQTEAHSRTRGTRAAVRTAGGIALAADITCHRAVGRNWDAPTCRGSAQADTITGSPRRDNVVAGKGDDTVNGAVAWTSSGREGQRRARRRSEQRLAVGGPALITHFGGPGSDVLIEGETKSSADVLDGGDGDD